MPAIDPFGARASLGPGLPDFYRLAALATGIDLEPAPVTIKVLLENVLRHAGGGVVRRRRRRRRSPRGGRASAAEAEVPFMPARVILQDFTGVPAIVDLAVDARRDGRPGRRPGARQPARARRTSSSTTRSRSTGSGRPAAFAFNVDREYERNGERYQLLRWAQTAFRDLRVVPPGTGIVHQVNLEFLATVVTDRATTSGGRVAFPDTLVGTDSHTTMINGLGVLGYGVGGIEAEAVLLGQPLYQPMPTSSASGCTASCRGARRRPTSCWSSPRCSARTAWSARSSSSPATAWPRCPSPTGRRSRNMSPEFGATATLFPIDDETLAYLRLTGRPPSAVALVERYAKEQGLWRVPGAGPDFDELAGARPRDRRARPWPGPAGRRTACR